MESTNSLAMLVYSLPLLFIWVVYLGMRHFKKRKTVRVRDEAREAGMTEPASLHPLINPNICIGCGSCVDACPEQPLHHVLGLISGKAHLVSPTDCIGHGACKRSCPMDAIELVFGTEKRGLDIPLVASDFQTNMKGIFIAGELGGMGLIRNAVEQGRQAMESIAGFSGVGKKNKNPDVYDVVIVGAGPAGFSATLGAMEKGLRHKTIDQDSLGGTVFQFPRGKLVMTAPVKLPIVGSVKFTETSKEALLAFWQKVEKEQGMQISYHEKVDGISKTDTGYEVKTSKGTYQTKTVLLAIGRRGTPRKLGVAGEEQPKVVYRLLDPEQYKGQSVVIVGGGDSALEAAVSISEEEGTDVTISYRSGGFSRAKEKNRLKVAAAAENGSLRVLMNSTVKQIGKENIQIDQQGEVIELPNDAVIVNAGGILPTPFLKEVGITVETKHGTA
ncbi:MAG: NAD(P)-binding domain-containing protein [Gammaproteobacteria bacterium]|nr:NAD(P)-binding domain-containing protein [Gammaproteobacteria bacterium]